MGKTTKGTQAAASPEAVREARRTDTTDGDTPQNRPVAPPTGPDPLIGEPEFLPQHTFISVPLPGDNGFIGNAIEFHEIAGLNPRTVGSIEEVLELLADSAQTGTGLLDRIRIVSHFFVPDPGDPLQASNMGIKFLRDSARGALKRHFEGFAESSIAGLRAMITFDLTGIPPVTTHFFFTSDSGVVLTALRAAGHGDLVDALPEDPFGDIGNEDLNEFILICASKWVINEGHVNLGTITCETNQHQAYDALLTHLRTTVAADTSLTVTQLDTLKTNILGLSSITGATFVAGMSANALNRHCDNVAAGLAAYNGDNFRNKILAVRPRFDRFTFVDIRGCRAGTDMDYLAAIQKFLGRSDTVRPVVTAPDWFQRYNQIGTVNPHGTTPQAQATAINQLYNNGVAPYSEGDVRSQFTTWADGYGINAEHLTFWHNTFQLHVLEFSKLLWPTAIPARNVTISRLDELATTNFNSVFDQLGEFFFIRNSRRPNITEIAAITPLLPNLNTWTSQLNVTIAAGTSASDLTTHFNNFKTIYEAVESRMGNPGFTSAQRLIPATEPAGFDVAQATTMQGDLRSFIDTNTNSKFASVHTFLTEADSLTQDARALMRYFLGLALPFQLFHPTSPNFDHQIIINFEDRTGPAVDRRQHEAIRHWIRASWRGVSPPSIPATVDYELGRHSAWVVEGRTAGPSGVCPHPNYMNHIITKSA